MRYLLAFLLAIAMTASAYASPAAQSRVCCASDECSVVDCMEMGCLPVASPLAAAHLAGFVGQAIARDVPAEATCYLPNRYNEIWTPPD